MPTSTSLEEAFGRVLRDLRTRRGFSQERLAHEAGLHRNTVGLLERAEKGPSLRVVFKLAATLEVNPSALVRRIERLLA